MIQLPVTTASGIEMRDTTLKRGVLCRIGTMDEYVVSECWRSYDTLPVKDRIVIDIGANIGAFTRWALEHGARRVVALEPEQSNHVCLCRNIFDQDSYKTLTYNACAALEDGETDLWLAPSSKNPGNTSQTPRRGRFKEEHVKTINVHHLMKKWDVQSVKMDCEGAEYEVGWPDLMPDSVKDVAAELHLSDKYFRSRCEEMIESYRAAGWRTVVEPKIKGCWNTLAHWTR